PPAAPANHAASPRPSRPPGEAAPRRRPAPSMPHPPVQPVATRPPPYSDNEHIMHQTGSHDPIHHPQNALRPTQRSAAMSPTVGKTYSGTRLMQFPRVPII